MKKNLILCVTFMLLGSAQVSWGQNDFDQHAGRNYQKGLSALHSGRNREAVEFFKPLAEQGHALAQHELALLYLNGLGVPQSFNEALKWMQFSAEQGDANSQETLGDWYGNGTLGRANTNEAIKEGRKEAFKWYLLAAEQGAVHAQYLLGSYYKLGWPPVPKDHAVAHMWYNIAARYGADPPRGLRDEITETMTAAQLAEAQALAVECANKDYKGC